MNSHANRGQALEEFIIMANGQYRSRGVALVEKVPTEWIPIRDQYGRIKNAKVEPKAPVDFFGNYGGKPIAFDAKHTNDPRINFNRVEPHQAQILDDWAALGGIAFVFVGMAMQRFFIVPWDFWRTGLDVYNKKKRPASFVIAKLSPEWEVKPGGRYILDYLSVVERLEGESLCVNV